MNQLKTDISEVWYLNESGFHFDYKESLGLDKLTIHIDKPSLPLVLQSTDIEIENSIVLTEITRPVFTSTLVTALV